MYDIFPCYKHNSNCMTNLEFLEANTINASIVAGGIKIALITTVSGLIVAIILQVFYNYILSKIDSIVLDMEEASMDLVDLLYKRKLQGK